MEMNRNELPDAYVIMYSVIDKSSFQRAEDDLARLQVFHFSFVSFIIHSFFIGFFNAQNWDAIGARALIIVGNKIDLVRSRAVSTQGIDFPIFK